MNQLHPQIEKHQNPHRRDPPDGLPRLLIVFQTFCTFCTWNHLVLCGELYCYFFIFCIIWNFNTSWTRLSHPRPSKPHAFYFFLFLYTYTLYSIQLEYFHSYDPPNISLTLSLPAPPSSYCLFASIIHALQFCSFYRI